MTKEQVLEILKLMDCEIAQVKIKFESEFVSDFKNEIAVPYQKVEEKTVQWYKVNSSMLKDEFGVILWKDLIDFMSHTIGFDYTITCQYTKPYTGVKISYENGQFVKL